MQDDGKEWSGEKQSGWRETGLEWKVVKSSEQWETWKMKGR